MITFCLKCNGEMDVDTSGHYNNHGEENYQITIVTMRCPECGYVEREVFDTRDQVES